MAGLPVGSRARLGDQTIIVTDRTAVLEDGTLAGSILTMDGAFRTLVQRLEPRSVDAARMCATTPAEQLGLTRPGRLRQGVSADLASSMRDLRVQHDLSSPASPGGTRRPARTRLGS